jgi:rhodanese-related sulfurtransferase
MILKSLMTAVFMLATMLVNTSCVTSQSSESTTESSSWQFHDIVDTKFVKDHLSIPMAEDVVLIDARPYKPKYVKGHIPGAISIPFTQFDKKKERLPKNKKALLIYYCGGLKCKLSHKSAKKAEGLGYTNVKVYAEGFPTWMKQKGAYASVSYDYVAKQVASKAATIIDARPYKPKYVKGHIPGAISIPFTKFKKSKDKLPKDLSQPIIFYCGGLKCKLSHKSAKAAIDMGYKKVSVFAMGYPEWKKRSGAKTKASAIKGGKEEGSIDFSMFKKTLKTDPDSLMIIDVRDPDEFKQGAFKTAQNIPVDKLEGKIKDLPTDKPIVFTCATGARSGEAFYMVQDVRPSLKNVYYLEAQVTFNKDGSYTLEENK